MRNYVFDITASMAELSERQEDTFEESVRLFMPANIVIDSWTSNVGEKRMWRVVGVIPGDTLLDMVNVLVDKVDRIREGRNRRRCADRHRSPSGTCRCPSRSSTSPGCGERSTRLAPALR
jgi:hypothetical protein